MSVYFIAPRFSGPFKIGMAKDPIRRMSELQTATYEKLELWATLDAWISSTDIYIDGQDARDSAVERAFHAHYHMYHLQGEWFNISFDRIHRDFFTSWTIADAENEYEFEPMLHCALAAQYDWADEPDGPFDWKPTPRDYWRKHLSR